MAQVAAGIAALHNSFCNRSPLDQPSELVLLTSAAAQKAANSHCDQLPHTYEIHAG
jgi:hypothetical protein